MKRIRFGRRGLAIGGTALAAMAAAGGIAYATIPGPGNVYSACMLKGLGTIRLIDKSLPSTNLMSRCTDKEAEISWNQAGQPGPSGAAALGWAVGNQTASTTKTVTASAQTTMAAPAGHMGGPNLAIAQIGDPARGARLWQSKRCADCHSYGGRGGEDAPPLDFMRGHMSAREIADMSGQIWDHMPAMLPHFREEKIPVPTFTQGEMT